METGYQIKQIPASLTYSVRRPVLRPGRPAEECYFEGDNYKDTFHLGLYTGESLTGVASFMKASHPEFSLPAQYQLRGMAVLDRYKGKGQGAALLKEGENILQNLDPAILLWFNARVHAVNFYEKFGYQSFGEKFNIPGVCEHIVMFKKL